MPLADTAKLVAELTLKDKMSRGLTTASKNLGTFEKGLGRAGKGVGQIGAGIARSTAIVGAAAVTGLGFVAKAAIDFEDAFAGVRKTVEASDVELDRLAKSFRTMATEIPIAASEFARIGELGGALGVPTKDLEAFTRTVALLGVTTDLSVEDAATALGQLQNTLGLTGDEFDNFASVLVDLGNKGSSTESAIVEVARRSASAARLIGVAKDETAGWAAAVANLGEMPELAGTALQMFFSQSLSLVSAGGEKLDDFAKVAGSTAKQFKKDFDKDASGALERFIKGLRKMPKDARLATIQKLFGKRSGLTRVILGLADSYDKNLSPAIDNASVAWDKNNALSEEARKRFATVRSSIDLLKNNLVEAALTIGGDASDPKSFIGAIGGAARKLSEFLKDPANKKELEQFGSELGAVINDIKWDEVMKAARGFVDIIKDAVGFGKTLFDLFNSLPGEIKGATVALLALNKASGGLIGSGVGNFAGGIAETIVRSLGARIPGVGKAFVQPVFVTNFPAGGLGGGAGGAAGAAGAAGAGAGLSVGAVLGPLAIAAAIGEAVRGPFNDALKANFKNPFEGGLGTGIITGIHNLQEVVRVAGQTQREATTRAGSNTSSAILRNGFNVSSQIKTAASMEQRRGERLVLTGQQTKAAVDASKSRLAAVGAETKRETTRGAQIVRGAINAKDLSMNVRVVNNLRLSVRDTAHKLSFQENMAIYG